ncbi:Cys-tRNA(Pro) deacylase [Rothia sp. p3-SID1597]|nr:Cys-tRNA(Pro) deacylase [Rothia sp. p3-SID1597]
MSKKSSKHSSGAPTAAVTALIESGYEYTLHPFEHEDTQNFGAEAAAALGHSADRVFKTLMITHDDDYALAVVPVSGSLAVKKAAAALGWKSASLAPPAVAEKRSGYVLGGMSPLGQKNPVRVVVDASAREHPTVFVSGGKRGLDVELAPDDLVAAARGDFADIAAQ